LHGKLGHSLQSPGHFTQASALKFTSAAMNEKQLARVNCEPAGLSVDAPCGRIAWLLTLWEKIECEGMENVVVIFPPIDDSTTEVAKCTT